VTAVNEWLLISLSDLVNTDPSLIKDTKIALNHALTPNPIWA
jgi:hypothetical protein